MPQGASYALLSRVDGHTKPAIYPSLDALARRIHRDRGVRALELKPATVTFKDHARDCTEVLALDEGDRIERIGFAWIARGDWRVLQVALDAALPRLKEAA